MIKTDNVIISRVYDSGRYIGTSIMANVKGDECNSLPLELTFNLDSNDMKKLDLILALAIENFIHEKEYNYKTKN